MYHCLHYTLYKSIFIKLIRISKPNVLVLFYIKYVLKVITIQINILLITNNTIIIVNINFYTIKK